ncbi:MAG: hypothetical protein L3V56_06100 [Candidatus Magnetoovum sp. WYHC-5]|nr:hypothetical protein [Candidatus Magnetoovum sp. WYHC-5]
MHNLGQSNTAINISIITLGASSIITQLVMMQEFISIFAGNELVYGLTLGAWFLFTGIGSFLGKWFEDIHKERLIRILAISQIVYGILPFLGIFCLRVFLNHLFLPGVFISIPEILFIVSALLVPYCLLGGALMTLVCILLPSIDDTKSIGEVYFFDNIGDIIGGALFSFIFIHIFSTFINLYFVMGINLLAALALIKRRLLAIVILPFIVALCFTEFMDSFTLQRLFQNQSILFHANSPYGQIVVTRNEGQLTFYENRVPLFASKDTVAAEETVHYPLSQLEGCRNVLMVSGCISGALDELLKYPAISVDCIEIDPLIFKAAKGLKPLYDKRVNFIVGDGRFYIKNTKNRYQAVILALPEPESAQINRFYTDEFFKELKRIIPPDGIISLSLRGEANYISKEVRRLNSIVYNTLGHNFQNVLAIPGERFFYIASDATSLQYNKIGRSNIPTNYVNDGYLKGILTKERIDYMLSALNEKTPLNTDFRPLAYYYNFLYLALYYKTNLTFLWVSLIVITLIIMVRLTPQTFAIFTTGFAASALEVILILAFQVLYGSVYSKTGLIITAFMLGLSIGAYVINKTPATIKLLYLFELLIAAFCLCIMGIIIYSNSFVLSWFFEYLAFPLLSVVIGILSGAEFPLVSKLYFKTKGQTAATLYFADYAGGFLGAIAVSTLLVPLIGIFNVCLIVGTLKLISLIILLPQGHRPCT